MQTAVYLTSDMASKEASGAYFQASGRPQVSWHYPREPQSLAMNFHERLIDKRCTIASTSKKIASKRRGVLRPIALKTRSAKDHLVETIRRRGLKRRSETLIGASAIRCLNLGGPSPKKRAFVASESKASGPSNDNARKRSLIEDAALLYRFSANTGKSGPKAKRVSQPKVEANAPTKKNGTAEHRTTREMPIITTTATVGSPHGVSIKKNGVIESPRIKKPTPMKWKLQERKNGAAVQQMSQRDSIRCGLRAAALRYPALEKLLLKASGGLSDHIRGKSAKHVAAIQQSCNVVSAFLESSRSRLADIEDMNKKLNIGRRKSQMDLNLMISRATSLLKEYSSDGKWNIITSLPPNSA